MGAKNYSQHEREENDYYATDPKAANLLMNVESFSNIWECACGGGHLSKEFIKSGYNVYSSDLFDRGYGDGVIDFLETNSLPINDCDIVTNPPYKYASEFVEHAMELLEDGHKCAMFLKIQFLEGKGRLSLFKKYPPKYVYVSSERLLCAINGDFDGCVKSSAVCYAWFVWEKGYTGDTVVRWLQKQ